jgi:Protein tyrosine and serine/threonine kinase
VREEPLKLVITDFGLSQLLPPGEKSVSAKSGSEIPFRWVDPSSVRQMKFTKKSDGTPSFVFLFSIVLLVWCASSSVFSLTAFSVVIRSLFVGNCGTGGSLFGCKRCGGGGRQCGERYAAAKARH